MVGWGPYPRAGIIPPHCPSPLEPPGPESSGERGCSSGGCRGGRGGEGNGDRPRRKPLSARRSVEVPLGGGHGEGRVRGVPEETFPAAGARGGVGVRPLLSVAGRPRVRLISLAGHRLRTFSTDEIGRVSTAPSSFTAAAQRGAPLGLAQESGGAEVGRGAWLGRWCSSRCRSKRCRSKKLTKSDPKN